MSFGHTHAHAQVRNFFNWYRKYFHYMVHHHHDVEEKIYVPEMAKKFQVPPKITADHKQLVAALDGKWTLVYCELCTV